MKSLFTSLLHRFILATVVVFIATAVAGCKFTVAGKQMRVLVTTRVPERTVEHGYGEKVRMESLEPSGDTFFVVIRTND